MVTRKRWKRENPHLEQSSVWSFSSSNSRGGELTSVKMNSVSRLEGIKYMKINYPHFKYYKTIKKPTFIDVGLFEFIRR